MSQRLSSLVDGSAAYDVVLADPPWPMWGDPNKDAAAGKHYSLMTTDQIHDMPVRGLFREKGALFLWATCPRLNLAFDAIRAWGLHYRGVAFIWTKTRRDGAVIGAQGIPPTGTKPTAELCLLATTNARGRPFPLLDAAVRQDVFAPRGRHSEKPDEIRKRIVRLYGDRPRVELFARAATDGWDRWGLEAPPASAPVGAPAVIFTR
jgi:N6-adenosine-specific RNA methylase IME4